MVLVEHVIPHVCMSSALVDLGVYIIPETDCPQVKNTLPVGDGLSEFPRQKLGAWDACKPSSVSHQSGSCHPTDLTIAILSIKT